MTGPHHSAADVEPTPAFVRGLASGAGYLLAGTVVIVFDFRLGAFDVVHDVIGAVLVVAGLHVLRGLEWTSPPEAQARLDAAVGLAVAHVVFVVLAEMGVAVEIASAAAGLLSLCGVLLLASVLHRHFQTARAGRLERAWYWTFHLVAWVYGATVALSFGLGFLGTAGATTIDNPIIVILVIVSLAPFVALIRALYLTWQVGRTAAEVSSNGT